LCGVSFAVRALCPALLACACGPTLESLESLESPERPVEDDAPLEPLERLELVEVLDLTDERIEPMDKFETPDVVPARPGDWLVPTRGPITTRFGERPDGSLHDAIDIAAEIGTEVVAPADLRVRTIAYQTRAGRYVIADARRPDGSFRGAGWRLTFAHLSHVDAVEGQDIAKGTMLGLIGLSGTASGPHLHLRVERAMQRGGADVREPVDPLTVFDEADVLAAP
jgi:murein DD-endopeptidase MepM/ murein hydrolase activator NlpD